LGKHGIIINDKNLLPAHKVILILSSKNNKIYNLTVLLIAIWIVISSKIKPIYKLFP
jgi:hypothetical protein